MAGIAAAASSARIRGARRAAPNSACESFTGESPRRTASEMASWSKVSATVRRGASIGAMVVDARPRLTSRILASPMATTERDYYEILGVERTATDAEIKRAFRKLAQQWHPDVNTDPAAQERFKEINEAYQVLSDPERRQRYDMFGRAGVDGGGGPGGAGFEGFGGFADIFDAFFGGGGGRRVGPARPAAARLGPALRPADHLRGGGPRHREGDRVPRPPALRDVRRQRRQARHRADHLPAVQRPRRGPLASARRCSARWSTSAPARAATARARSSRRRATRATATAGPSASGRSGSRSRPGIDEGHQIRLSNEGEVGPRGGPPGSLYVAVHVQPHPSLKREGTELSTRPRSRSPRPRSGRGSRSRRSTATEEVEIKAGTQPGTEIRLRGKGVPHLRRAGQRGDLHVHRRRRRPDQALEEGSASCSTAYAEESGEPVGAGGGGLLREARARGEPRRRPRAPAAPGAWLELSVEADVEAVEAVSEILGRAAPGGTSRRAGVRARRRGPRRADRPDPAGDRPRLPAGARPRRGRPRRGRGRPRRSAISRRSGCARSASCGRGSSTRPTGPRPGRRTSRSCGSAGGWSSGRPGGATAARPTTSSSPSTRGWRSGPGSIRRRGCAWPASRRSPTAGVLAGARVLDVGCGSGILAIAALQARRGERRSASTPTRSPSRRRSPTPAATRSSGGSGRARAACPSGERAVRRRPRQPDRRRPRRRSRRRSRDELRPGGDLARVGDLHRPRGRGPRGVRGGRARGRRPDASKGDWVALEARPAGPDRPPRAYNRRDARATSRSCSSPTSSSRSACSCRRSCCRSRCGRGARRSSRRAGVVRALLWAQTHGTLVDRPRAGAHRARPHRRPSGSAILEQPWLLVALAIYVVNLGHRLLHPAPEPAPPRRDPGRRRRPDLAGAGQAPALRLVPDGRAGRHDRLPDEHEAGALVTTATTGRAAADCLFCRIVGRRDPVDARPRGRPGHRVPRHRAARADPHPAHPAPPHRVGGRPDRRRRPAARPAVRASPPTSPARRASPTAATGSSRTSGAGAARPSTTSTST